MEKIAEKFFELIQIGDFFKRHLKIEAVYGYDLDFVWSMEIHFYCLFPRGYTNFSDHSVLNFQTAHFPKALLS